MEVWKTRYLALTMLMFLFACSSDTKSNAEEVRGELSVVLVTLDGVRWQEVFRGIDKTLVDDERYTRDSGLLRDKYWHDDANKRRELLLPFLWSRMAPQGAVIGNRDRESYIEVNNEWWFSYPGYNELLAGKVDLAIKSNDKVPNPNINVFEIINGLPEYGGRVLAFGSWDVFPYIMNTERSRIPVSTDIESLASLNIEAEWLVSAAETLPNLWPSTQLDFFTGVSAIQALKELKPRATYIAFGETDEFAHEGRYDMYIDAIHRSDIMISKIWETIQSDPNYRDRTTLVVTTDHGRGNTPDSWIGHGSPKAMELWGITDAPDGRPGSNEVWLAAIGPSIKAAGEISGHWRQSQVAATVMGALRLSANTLMPDADEQIDEILQ